MFSLVIPVFKNESSIPDLLRCLEDLTARTNGDLEVVFVIDGSPDKSSEILRERLQEATFRSQLLGLSRNFGSFAAIRAGLEHGRGEHFGVMAADCQEPPELILEFREKLLSGECDVVVGSRSGRADPWAIRVSSGIFWGLYRLLVQNEVPRGGVDVFACSRSFRDHLLELRESNSTLVGLLFWLGFRRAEVEYCRRPRRHGKGAWSLHRKVRYLLDSAFAFTDLPIRLLSLAGICGILVSVVIGSVVLTAKIFGAIPIPGYTATILVVMFFGGLNSLGLGILGEYMWRAFENTKSRPGYVVEWKLEYRKEEKV